MLSTAHRLLDGKPARCALETCQREFNGAVFQAGDGRCYCAEDCAIEAANQGLKRIENVARLLSSRYEHLV
jgi:hypothetical protein